MDLRVTSSGRLFRLGDWFLDDDPKLSPLNKLDAIPCSEDQDVSHRPVANVVGEVCDPNRLGLRGGLMLFCCLCTFPLVCAGRDGYLPGIGETALEGVPDDVDEASSRDVFVK